MKKMLSQDELVRYQRQLIIPDFGEEGQSKLKDASAIIIGVGGLGCSSAIYLTAAGVGHITIVDFDTVELSDLNRQILYGQDDIGEKKVVAAGRRLKKLNSSIEINPVFSEIKEDNVLKIISGAKVVLDGTDNLASRLILNSACVKLKIPFIVGGVSRLRGMVTTIIPGTTPCLACFQPEGLRGLGVLGVIPAVIANIQTLEAIKLLVGHKPALAGSLLLFNGDEMKFRNYQIHRNESCQVCSVI
jgi:molybdopterin/thiamine biosynthesis adenylyltransferase